MNKSALILLWKVSEITLNQKVFFDVDECNFYSGTDSGEVLELYPLSEKNESPITHFSRNRILSLSDFVQSENIGINQKIIGTLSVQNRTNQQIEIGSTSEANQSDNGKNQQTNSKKSEVNQNIIGEGKTDLQKFSMLYAGNIFEAAKQIENLLVQIISNTDKPTTLEKTVTDYNEAKKYAEKGDLFHLKKIATRLEGRLKKQGGIDEMHKTSSRNKKRKRIIYISLTIIVLSIISYWLLINKTSPTINNFSSKMNYDSLINVYQINYKPIKSDWRKQQILDCLNTNNFSTETLVYSAIDSINNKQY